MILTVGHSNHSADAFMDLLVSAEVTAVADVRSTPRSRFAPWFDAMALKTSLTSAGISYVPMMELGGRPAHHSLYVDGHADYEAMARTPEVAAGIDRLVQGRGRHRIAVMCAEKEPLDCHRCLLVARLLAEKGVEVEHLHADGRRETQTELEERLMRLTKEVVDMFGDRSSALSSAYRRRSAQAAYKRR